MSGCATTGCCCTTSNSTRRCGSPRS
ncbi:hypothetical protein ABZ783_35860 [Micromonospora sp. NPDC047738]